MQLVLDTSKISLTKKNQSFFIKSEKGNRTISPLKITSVAVTANVMIETGAIRLAIQHQIPIIFFDHIGKASARLWSPHFSSISTLRRQQVRFADTRDATMWMIDVFAMKMEGQVANLKLLRGQRKAYAIGLTTAIHQIRKNNGSFQRYRDELIEECRNSLMGIEGTIARVYWQALGTVLPRPYAFAKRSRRPAEDIFNAAINYLYGMLYSVVEGSLFAVGLDPQLGLLHVDEYTKPTLAFDLIEVFRPWVDALLIEQCLNKKLEKSFFSKNQYGLFLNKAGKAFIIPLFNAFLRSERKYLNQQSTVKNHIHHVAGLLTRRIRTSVD